MCGAYLFFERSDLILDLAGAHLVVELDAERHKNLIGRQLDTERSVGSRYSVFASSDGEDGTGLSVVR